jgi:multidrug efflux pump subunit AcrA (membrane-fusion protein)
MTTTRQEENRRGSLEEASVMLPQQPTPWIARAIAWLLIAIFFATLAAAIVVRVPETVKCRFVLVPREGADPMQSPYPAIVSQIRVTEGDEVAAGAELFVLRSDEILNFRTQLGTLNEDLGTKKENSAKLEASYRAQIDIKNSEITQVQREVEFREKHASTNRDLVARLEKLSASGGISQIELIQHQLDLAGSEKDLNLAQKALDQAQLERKRMETEREGQRTEERADIQKLTFRIAALQSELQNSEGNLLSIRAPYNAVVISLAQRNAGTVVQAGQELCQLARVGVVPRVRLILQERGISGLTKARRVRLFFDAFPYQRYGTITGRLDWISPAAITTPEGQNFVALASLDETSIRAGGGLRTLQVGMKGEARIVTGSRALIEYAFEPIRQLRENMRP